MSSRHLASMKPITEIRSIPRADKLEVAIVQNAWQVVVPKNLYHVGDWVIFCEADSILPKCIVPFPIPGETHLVETTKIRGAVSEGLILPVSTLDGINVRIFHTNIFIFY